MGTPVIFKREGRDVLAVFPRDPGTHANDATVYAHVGQHASASIAYVRSLKPAKPNEYADLLRELESVGYTDLEIRRRMTAADAKARRAAMAEMDAAARSHAHNVNP